MGIRADQERFCVTVGNIVFITACPLDYAQNYDDCDGMHEMFIEQGLGFTNITVSCHHNPEDKWRYEQTLKMSEARSVYAMEDMSAFFIKEGKIDVVGKIWHAENRELRPITEDDIHELEQDI